MRYTVLVLAALLAASIVAVDLFSPLGVALGGAYVLVVLLSAETRRPWVPIAFAALATILMGIGWYASPTVVARQAETEIANRLVALLVIWAVAIWVVAVSLARLRTGQEPSRANESLRQSEPGNGAMLEKRTDKELGRGEEEFFDLFEHAAIGLHWVAPDGTVLRVNQAELDLLGYHRDEYVGHHIAEFHADQPVIEDILARLSRGETLRDYPVRMRCKDGSIRDTVIDSNVLFEDGKFIHSRCVTRDVTKRKRAEEALRESEERYRAVVQSQAEMLCRFRPDGEILFVNPAYARARGTTPEGLIGGNFWDFISEPDRPAVRELLDRLTAEAPEIRIENRFETTDGERWVLWINRALAFDREGRLMEAQSSGIDITDRRQAEEALRETEQRFARFMQHLPGLAWIKDTQGRYVYANDAAVNAFRTPRGRLYGMTDEDVFPAATAAQFEANDRQALASEAGIQVVETLEHEDGVVHHSIVSKFPIPGQDGRAGLVGGMAIDITERKRAEEALKEADRRKDEFLATLAHELRNPLTPLRNMLEVMKRADDNAAVLQQARDTMERQLGQMIRLIDDLLDVNRISRGKINLRRERVELTSIVNEAVSAVRPICEDMDQELAVTVPPTPIYLNADQTRLVQVLGNLLQNASKFTPRDGRIQLVVEREDEGVMIRVQDTGIGIASDQLPRIFDMFAQVETSLERSQGGLGIGLTLVKNLVDLHEGALEASSAGLGQGSEFIVRLPVLKEMPTSQSQPPSEKKLVATVRHRILVVDDNRDSADSLGTLFKLSGHEVHTAFDGLEAVEAAVKFQPDVILLDIGLPHLNGYDAARRIREHAKDKRMVLVALTGWSQESDRNRAREAGFDHHLTKPPEPAALQAVLDAVPPREAKTDGGQATSPASAATPSAWGNDLEGRAAVESTDALRQEPSTASRRRSTSEQDVPDPEEMRKLVHDLRNALYAMVVALRTIEQKTKDEIEVQDLIKRALTGGEELGALIDSLRIWAPQRHQVEESTS